MARLQHLTLFSFAALHLLLFSICPVNGRIYRTKDAVVIEVSDTMASNLAEQPLIRFANSNFGYPGPIPVNSYTGLRYLSYPNFPSWPYTLYRPTSSFSDVKDLAATAPEFRQQSIACGVGPASLPRQTTPTVGIVGGSNAEKNSWPPMVGLRIAGGNVYCGGSIISQTKILTAAHCVEKLSASDISEMTVSLGMHTQGNGNTLNNDAKQTRRVTRVVYHIDFDVETMVNDVAILTMDPPINYSKAISPVCLPPVNTTANQYFNQNAVILGWGLLNPDGSQPNALQQATVRITNRARCRRAWESAVSILNQHICAGADDKDVCQGDGGGPLVVQAEAGSNAWTLVGITSFGKRCPASLSLPSVFASVAFFRGWIDTYMNS